MATENDDVQFEQDQAEIDRILESDDPDEISKLFGADESGQDTSEPTSSSEPEPEPEPEPDPETDKPKAEPEPEPEPEPQSKDKQEDEPEPDLEPEGVLMKDGKTVAPYKLLETARQGRHQAEQERDELRKKLEEINGRSSKMEKVLKDNGINADDFGDGDDLSDEQLEAIAEESPVVAKAIRALQAKTAKYDAQLEDLGSRDTVDPVELAIRDNPDLNSWRRADKDRYEMAQHFDGVLLDHPEWKAKPYEERFAEAVRLTKLEFRDAIPEPSSQKKQETEADAQKRIESKKAQAQQRSAPTSLSDLGQRSEGEKSITEQLAEMNEGDLEDRMANMSQAELDQLFANGF